MSDATNPYQPPSSEQPASDRWSLRHRLAVAHGIFGGAIPVTNAVWIIVNNLGRPTPPGTVYFGTPSVGALILLFFGAPILAVIFATVGGFLGVMVDLMTKRGKTPDSQGDSS